MDFSLSSSLVGSAVSNPDKLALDLQFATDKTLTARKGPTPVFTRGSGATFVDSDGLIKYAPENLLLQSENFLSGWTVFGASVQSVSSTNPFGGGTSYKLIESAANAEHGIFRSSVISSGLATESIYAKESGRRFCYLRSDATTLAVFDLIGGTVTQVSAGTTAFMTDAGNGWWRLTFTSQIAGNYVLKLSNVGTGIIASTSYLGNGTSGVLIWGAQLERSSTARTYVPTTTAAVYGPRFDHDPVTGICKGLLIEESRTNAAWYSGALVVGTGWNANVTPSVTSIVDGLGPDGNNAYEITEIANTGTHTLYNSGGSGTTGATSVVSGTTYTGSIFVKKAAGSVDWIQLSFSTVGFGPVQYANFNISNGTIGNFSSSSPQIQDAGNGWYRCSISAVATATTTTTNNLLLVFTDNADTTTRLPSYAGSTANKILAAMGQFEAGSFATSYIPTTTASVIRSADVCSISGSDFSRFYNTSDGTLFSQSVISDIVGLNRGIVNIRGGATLFMRHVFSNSLFRIQVRASDTETNIQTITGLAFTAFKIALAYSGNNFASSINNSSPSLVTRTLPTGLNELRIGSLDTASQLNGTISSLRYYKKRLPDAKLQALTV